MASPLDIEAARALGLDWTAADDAKASVEDYIAQNYEQPPGVEAPVDFSPAPAPSLGVDTALAAPQVALPEETPVEPDLRKEAQRRSTSVSQSESAPVVTQLDYKPAGPVEGKAYQEALGRTQRMAPGLQSEIDARRETTDAEVALNDQMVENQKEIADFVALEANAEAAADQVANQKAQARIDEISQRVEEVRSMKVDPQQFWTDGGAMHNAAGIMSAFVGGFLAPVLGKNTIQQTLDRIVERDIDAQKANIAGQREGVKDLRMLHGLGLQQEEASSASREEQRLMRKASLLGQLEAQTMKLQDPILRGKSEQEIAKIKQGLAKELDTIYAQEKNYYAGEEQRRIQNKLASQRVSIARKSQRLAEAQFASRERDKEEARRAASAAAAREGLVYSPLNHETIGRYVPGLSAKDKQDFGSRLNWRAQSTDKLREITEEFAKAKSLYQGPGERFAQSKEALEIKAKYARWRNREFADISGAAISEQEAERLKAGLPDPESWTTRNPAGALRDYVTELSREQELDANQYLESADRPGQAPSVNYKDRWGVKEDIGNPRVFFNREVKKAADTLSGAATPEEQAEAAFGTLAVANERDLPPGSKQAKQMVDLLYAMPREERELMVRLDGTDPVAAWEDILENGSGKYNKRETKKARAAEVTARWEARRGQ